MSKLGWDLPPGVTHRMIEEAAGDDPAEETYLNELYGHIPQPYRDLMSDDEFDKLCAWCWQQMGEAYHKGYKQGMDDEKFASEIERAHEREKDQ